MSEQKKIPAAALRLSIGPCEFGDNGPDAKTAPIRMLARSGQSIDHWYWGKVVHDMSGMTLHKSRVPIDYVHNAAEVLGFLNHFDTETGDLVATGTIVPFRPDVEAGAVAEGKPVETAATELQAPPKTEAAPAAVEVPPVVALCANSKTTPSPASNRRCPGRVGRSRFSRRN